MDVARSNEALLQTIPPPQPLPHKGEGEPAQGAYDSVLGDFRY